MKIGLKNKDGTVTDIVEYTYANAATWENIKGEREVIIFDDVPPDSDLKPLKFDGAKVVIDSDKITKQELEKFEKELIAQKMEELAKAELIKEGKIYG